MSSTVIAFISLLTAALGAPLSPPSEFTQNVTLTVESENSEIAGQGLTNLHFGAGINGLLLTEDRPVYQYDPVSNQVATIITISGGEKIPYVLSEFDGDLIAGVIGEPFAHVESGHLAINGSDSVFYACTKLNFDRYGYLSQSNYSYGVGVYASDVPSVCEPIKIKVDYF